MKPRIPRIKICGITNSSDLDFIQAFGADTVGINLVPTSKRNVRLEAAVELVVQAKELGLQTVAVLMNPTAEWLNQVCRAVQWDFIQLHGAESPELLGDCPSINVIKAVSWSGRQDEEALVRRWDEWGRAQTAKDRQSGLVASTQRLVCFLVDAYSPAEGGGTGITVEWGLLNPRHPALEKWPVLLAGGLKPSNVRQAVIASACDGVDVASGVEILPGRKSAELVEEFALEANVGFAESAVKPLQ